MNRTEELIKDAIFGVKKLVGLDKENKQNHSEVISKIDDVSKGIKTSSETVAQSVKDLEDKIDVVKAEVDKKQTVYVKSEVKMPDEMSIKEPKWWNIKTIATDLIQYLESIKNRVFTVKLDQNSKRPDDFINVRLTNGKEHYEATGGGSIAGFGVPDALVENQTNGQQKTQTLDVFNVNNISTVGAITYIGMEDKDGVYCIKKIDSTTDNVFTYATITNNPNIITYANAWAGILTNTYSIYSLAF